ncbi:iron-sulfur cluster assembly scaffold protein [Methanolobus vulcani]|jgi:nitrogen fixation NifU-like protein|uniref:Iron-sulfur cluster assembly scaffold protein n=1 Tax=Methanolobus vulcani TaxID=38026 RepID=A0A7Z8KPL1_9EURY|nr:iron-sulfur cluster assembly scaffold protein [Methanolobus vulcani]TQD26704.1 iron-sulfur cluster assembly scaffold protein [Methanolobus vulcani]
MYSKKVMEEFSNPANVGVVEDADGVGEVGSTIDGDIINISIKVKDNILEDVKFKTFGCVVAISTSSAVVKLAKGKTVDEAMALTNEDVISYLDGLPEGKDRCSGFALDALKMAINDYIHKNK